MSLSETILSVKNSFSPNLIKTGCPKSYTYLFSFFQNIIWNLQVFWHIRKNLFLNIMHHPHLTNIIYMHLIPQIELKNRLNKTNFTEVDNLNYFLNSTGFGFGFQPFDLDPNLLDVMKANGITYVDETKLS